MHNYEITTLSLRVAGATLFAIDGEESARNILVFRVYNKLYNTFNDFLGEKKIEPSRT